MDGRHKARLIVTGTLSSYGDDGAQETTTKVSLPVSDVESILHPPAPRGVLDALHKYLGQVLGWVRWVSSLCVVVASYPLTRLVAVASAAAPLVCT